MNDDELIAELRAIVSRRRMYAGFYDWPDKAEKEAGILETFFDAVAADYPELRIANARLAAPGQDPPDAWAESVADGLVGIEIVELVDGDLVKRAEQQKRDIQRQLSEQRECQRVLIMPPRREWTAEQFREKLVEIAKRKDAGEIKDRFAQYQGYWLLVHTDESALSPDRVRSYVRDFALGPCKLITRCLVLMSYQPGPRPRPATAAPQYPVIEVDVTT